MINRVLKFQARDPGFEVVAAFDETIKQYTDSYNRVAKIAWEQTRINKTEVHKLTYYDEKSKTNLPSQLLCSARVRACESAKSAKTKLKKGEKVSCPKSRQVGIRYDARSATIKLKEGKASLVTVEGRKEISFHIPGYVIPRLDWKVCSSELRKTKQGKYLFYVVVSAENVEYPLSEHVTGVDLGVNRPAVTSDRKFFGKKRWKEIEKRNFRLKRKLQAKGTKSAKKHLRKLSGKVNRFRIDCDHVLSKRLVESVPYGSTLVFEDLKHIRNRVKARKQQRRRIHAWSFDRLKGFVEYKSEMYGHKVELIDPHYTSQRCSSCGHVSKKNRKTQSEFRCCECNFQHNADLNASLNIRFVHLAGSGIAVPSGPTVNRPIVSSSTKDLVTSSVL